MGEAAKSSYLSFPAHLVQFFSQIGYLCVFAGQSLGHLSLGLACQLPFLGSLGLHNLQLLLGRFGRLGRGPLCFAQVTPGRVPLGFQLRVSLLLEIQVLLGMFQLAVF